MRLLADGAVRRQQDLVRLLRKAGYAVTQSSISRDLREIGVLKARGRYELPPREVVRTNGKFTALAQFVQQIKCAGPCLTVITHIDRRCTERCRSHRQGAVARGGRHALRG